MVLAVIKRGTVRQLFLLLLLAKVCLGQSELETAVQKSQNLFAGQIAVFRLSANEPQYRVHIFAGSHNVVTAVRILHINCTSTVGFIQECTFPRPTLDDQNEYLSKIGALKPLGKLRWTDEVKNEDYGTNVSLYENAVVETFTEPSSMAETGQRRIPVIEGMVVYYFQKVTASVVRKTPYEFHILTGESLRPEGKPSGQPVHSRLVIVTAGAREFLVASEEEAARLVPNARATFIGAGPLLPPARDSD